MWADGCHGGLRFFFVGLSLCLAVGMSVTHTHKICCLSVFDIGMLQERTSLLRLCLPHLHVFPANRASKGT